MEIKIINQSVVYADCDAIVNAANEKLQNGGGVCGAIFAAAGAYELCYQRHKAHQARLNHH